MSAEADTPAENLAFLKSLVSEGPRTQKSAGTLFLVGGVVYGLQCLVNSLQIMLGWKWPAEAFFALGIVPTVIFMGWVVWLMWRNRNAPQHGVATRAMKAAFTGAGLANIAMCAVFGWVAATEKSFVIWMLYPAVVSALQGACWYVAYIIRKQLWLAGVSGGWLVTAIGLGFMVRDPGNYLMIFAIALFVLMALPGYIMLRNGSE